MTATDRTDAPTSAFDARLAEIEAATPDPDGCEERVARAIADVLHHGPLNDREWQNLFEANRQAYREAAVASINSMKAPEAFDPTAALRCPYCGSGLFLEMTTEVTDNTEREVPDGLRCVNEVRCGASWETDGTVRFAPALSSPAGPDADGGAE